MRATAETSLRRIDYERELNAEQLEVVMAGEGAFLVIAGAGSGKTRTLTYRVARLIETGVRPQNILLMTFTNKAAREMIDRVIELTGNIRRADLWAGTFHSIANRILRRYGTLLGYKAGFTIMDQDDSVQLMNSCIGELGYDTKNGNFPKARVVSGIYSFARNTDVDLGALLDKKHRFFQNHKQRIIDLAELYETRKREQNLMDFDDLLINLRFLFSHNEGLRDDLAERFHHVLIDEYQDTNSIQNDLVEMLSGKARSVMCVGDDFQSIYSFRGAVFDNIMGFPKRFRDAKVFYLERNYRSTPEIVKLANRSIAVNKNQYEKSLYSMRKSGSLPQFVETEDSSQQAVFVAENVLKTITDGVRPSEIAILYRAHYLSMEVQMELTRRGVPFIVRGGPGFFERAHVKDAIAFLKVLSNPRDEIPWKRLLLLCEGIGKVSAEKMCMQLRESSDPILLFLSPEFLKKVPKKAHTSIVWLRDSARQAATSDYLPSPLITMFLEKGYGDYMQRKYENFTERVEDLRELAYFAGKYDNIEDFIAEIALISNDEEIEDPAAGKDGGKDGNKVVLSTIHQAKGLEWHTVFLVWCSDVQIPNQKAIEEDPVFGLEEERRLFYVSATRAREQLFLCRPEYDRRSGAFLDASRFITEICSDKNPLFVTKKLSYE